MLNILTYDVKSVNQEKNKSFGRWLDGIIEQTGLKKKIIAEKAEINPVSLSRILSGAHGTARETAIALINAINELAGRKIADIDTGLRLAAGYVTKNQADEIRISADGLTEFDKNEVIAFAEFKRTQNIKLSVGQKSEKFIEVSDRETIPVLREGAGANDKKS